MAIAMFFYFEYKTTPVTGVLGEQITVGPIRYMLTYEGIEKGNTEIRSDSTFMKINIISEDLSGNPTVAEKKQFFLLDQNSTHTRPTHGIITDNASMVTAYFPLAGNALNDEFGYNIMIRPAKEHATTDLGIVCVTRCDNSTG